MPAATDAPVKIRIRDLHKSFDGKAVLRGVELEIRRGESMVVVGGSGTGKSVLLKHVIGLLKPDRGTVEVDGVAVETLGYREIARFRRRFGMAFQEGALFDSMTVAENVAFPLRRRGELRPDEIRRRVAECLAEVGLEDVGEKMPSELSGGMRRRVGFARAVAHEPEILLFDEPTTGLDPVTKRTIDALIVELRRHHGATTVTISHDMPSVLRIADRIAMLHEGTIAAVLTPDEFRRSSDPRIRDFLSGALLADSA